MNLKNNFWIKSPSFDWWWFIAPMAIPPLVALFLPHQFTAEQTGENMMAKQYTENKSQFRRH